MKTRKNQAVYPSSTRCTTFQSSSSATSKPSAITSASAAQLRHLVDFATVNGSIIVYDSSYIAYISGDNPTSMPFEDRHQLKLSALIAFVKYTQHLLEKSSIKDTKYITPPRDVTGAYHTSE
ncbi:unnamed protein product [Citrullus colocynthis]|uniref:Uncharacterized protein n=1 Tax=Citrullus colocynthis TaxID=252529 RepID=A0ABP0YZX1_9ROSI